MRSFQWLCWATRWGGCRDGNGLRRSQPCSLHGAVGSCGAPEGLPTGKNNAERLLLETRDSAEKQFDEFQQTNADLQLSNITLNQKLSELTTLHEIGVVLSATLDLDELLDKTLQAVTAHLSCDRAMILLVEERDGRRVLASGRSIGGTPEMAALTKGLEVSLEAPDSFLAQDRSFRETDSCSGYRPGE